MGASGVIRNMDCGVSPWTMSGPPLTAEPQLPPVQMVGKMGLHLSKDRGEHEMK